MHPMIWRRIWQALTGVVLILAVGAVSALMLYTAPYPTNPAEAILIAGLMSLAGIALAVLILIGVVLLSNAINAKRPMFAKRRKPPR